jgi:hypothetical protein
MRASGQQPRARRLWLAPARPHLASCGRAGLQRLGAAGAAGFPVDVRLAAWVEIMADGRLLLPLSPAADAAPAAAVLGSAGGSAAPPDAPAPGAGEGAGAAGRAAGPGLAPAAGAAAEAQPAAAAAAFAARAQVGALVAYWDLAAGGQVRASPGPVLACARAWLARMG